MTQPEISSAVSEPGAKNVFRALDVLRAVRRRIDPSERWTQHAYARNSSGAPCDPGNSAAKAWSLDGALEAYRAPLPAKALVEEAIHAATGKWPARLNDSSTYLQVREALSKAEDLLVRRTRKAAT